MNKGKWYVVVFVIAVVVLAIFIYLKTTSKNEKFIFDGVEIVELNIDNSETISEEKAREIAVLQFEKLGESNLDIYNLKLKKIERNNGEYFYYINSSENTLEISVKGGVVTRINNVLIER